MIISKLGLSYAQCYTIAKVFGQRNGDLGLAALALEPNEELKLVYVPTEKWSGKATELVKDLVDDAEETYLEFQVYTYLGVIQVLMLLFFGDD